MKPHEEKTQAEILESEIASLKSKIKNTEYDLANSFKGNALVESKLKNAQAILSEKQQLLLEIKNNPSANKELNKTEKNLLQGDNISEEQRKIVKDIVESEI